MKTKIKTLIWGVIPIVLFSFAFFVISCQQDEFIGNEESVLKDATLSAVTPVVYPDVFVGPETFTFTPIKGKLQNQTVTLTNADFANFVPPFALVIQNGNGSGFNAVRSANIYVNGTQVVGAADFRKAPGVFYKEITGLGESNIIKVEVKGATTGSLTLWIESTLPLSPTTFTDTRDGHVYKMVKIFNQVWMAENLAFETATGSWAYGNDVNNIAFYGRLYDWRTAMNGGISSEANPSGVRGLCPEGWHLPSPAEWLALTNFLGGDAVAGGKMKSTGTIEDGNGLWTSPNNGATNESGFSGLPGGYRLSDGRFLYKGELGMWWSTEQTTEFNAFAGMLANINIFVRWYSDDMGDGYSVRCIRDN